MDPKFDINRFFFINRNDKGHLSTSSGVWSPPLNSYLHKKAKRLQSFFLFLEKEREVGSIPGPSKRRKFSFALPPKLQLLVLEIEFLLVPQK